MFEQIYQDMKVGYKQSWFRLFFKYTALGKLLEQDTPVSAFTFSDTYLSSWWWNRLWFRACIRQKDNLSRFYRMLQPFSYLKKAELLTQENFALVANCTDSLRFEMALYSLQKARILTQANFTLVANHADLGESAYALYDLEYASILTQENFSKLTAPNHTALVSQESIQLIWSRIPYALLTQANFDRMVTASEDANPMAALERVCNEILGINILANHNQPGVHPGRAAFNQAQSTHTASVHRSVSESAARLMKNYGAGLALEATIQKIKTYVNSLDNSFKHLAAKRGIKRIASPYDTFTDSSGVTTRQLLALAYTAIHDETKRQGTLEDAQALFVDGLYEIQRGYNLNAEGIDNQNTEDTPICSAGTFNKLVEKLNGIHQDVEVYFITHEGLCLKFPKVVEECALNYLNGLTSPESAADYLKIKELLDDMKDKGLEPIWDKIKSAVEATLWDEFKEAYANKPEDARFRTMIEHGHDSNAPDLTALYSRLEASPGYKAFLYQSAQNSLGKQKSSSSLVQHGLWANGHKSTENKQKESVPLIEPPLTSSKI